MKECVACHNQVKDLETTCPHCGGGMFVSRGAEALSRIDAMQRQLEASELNDLGGQMVSQGRYPEAEEAFRRALEANPLNATAHSNLGAALYHQGRIEEGIEWLEKALELNPSLEGVPEALAQFKAEARTTRNRIRSTVPATTAEKRLAIGLPILIGFVVPLIAALLTALFKKDSPCPSLLVIPIGGAVSALVRRRLIRSPSSQARKQGAIAGLFCGLGAVILLVILLVIVFVYVLVSPEGLVPESSTLSPLVIGVLLVFGIAMSFPLVVGLSMLGGVAISYLLDNSTSEEAAGVQPEALPNQQVKCEICGSQFSEAEGRKLAPRDFLSMQIKTDDMSAASLWAVSHSIATSENSPPGAADIPVWWICAQCLARHF